MRKAIEFFIERPLVVNLLTFIIVAVGVFSLFTLQKETFPRVEFDVLIINTIYPGSSSEDVEKLVTIPIERKLKSVEGIKTTNGLSAEGRSIIYLEVDPDAELSEVEDDLKAAVDTVTDLPNDAEAPIITSASNKSRSVLKIAIRGGSYEAKRVVTKKLRDLLEKNKKLAQVELSGYNSDEIRVKVDPEKLNSFELTMGEVANAIRARNLNLSAGKLEAPTGDILVRTISEFEGPEDVANVVIRSNTSGQKVLVKDIASIEKAPVEGAVLQRSQGVEAIFLGVKIKESSDILKSTEWIKSTVKTYFEEKNIPEIEYSFVDDMSYFVERRLSILTGNGKLGMILVFCCLLLFLNFSTSVVTSLGAPIAFMFAFAMMDSMGISINLISMFALILVLGMLVDDSIIVAEQFYQRLEKGEEPKSAAKQAAFETIKPVTATIVTTMIAFGSIFFMGGIMGKFLWPVPAVVIICLMASWFECFFILPSHLADYCKLKKSIKKKRHWYEPLKSTYKKQLTFFVKHPFFVQLTFLFILIGTLFLAKTMNFELFPGDDVRTVYAQIKGDVGSPLENTDQAVKKIEELAMKELKEEEYQQVRAQVGVLLGDRGTKTGSHYGSLILYLSAPDERTRSTDEIITSLTEKAKELIPNYTFTIKKIQGGPPKGKPVEIDLIGDDLQELILISKRIEKVLSEEVGVTSTEIDFEDGKSQIRVLVNDSEASRLGLSTQQIALELRRALSGDSLTEIRESDEDIEIKIMFNDDAKSKVESLKSLHIKNALGRRIPISKMVTFLEEPGAFVIRRLDRKRVISISASLDKDKATPVGISQKLTPKIKDIIRDYPAIDFSFGGENKDTEESMQRLGKSGLIALSCIFFVLVLMFSSIAQPIIVMSAIPLGLIGVVLAFKAFNVALGFMAFMGVVALIGVVVNDSIVLVSFINGIKDQYEDVTKAVIEGSASRFRPVILTTVTTVAGLLPVAHDPGGDPFLKPMALAFAWGLLFASLVTLIFVPCTYVTYEKITNFLSNKWSQFRKSDQLV